MLHIVNKSPEHTNAFASCLRLAQPGSALLLIEDGVYAATRPSAMAEATQSLKVYVLQPDLDARGMAGRRVDGVTPVDYPGFVDLVAEHSNNQSWL
jgi:tRNA 2-thiouridine synthesizing protein B